MSDAEPTHSISDAHDEGHGHAPAGEPLGAIDWETWAYALAGAAMGALVALALFIASGS